jgi:putative CocE/NonD family hydrolase
MCLLLGAWGLLAAVSGALPAFAAGLAPRPGAFEPPPASFQVDVTKDLQVPMRDGVHLATDLYWPHGVTGKLPVILIRTPYGKDRDGYAPVIESAQFFASHGFAVVTQDFRGRFRSEGLFRFTRGHGDDGYDTFQWLIAQPWSTGKIGTYGCSYVGEVQLYQALKHPPGLTAMIPQASGTAIGSAGGYYSNAADLGGGAWQLSVIFDWFYKYGGQTFFGPRQPLAADRDRAGAVAEFFRTPPTMPAIDYSRVLWHLPLIDMMDQVTAPPNEYNDFLRHNLDFTDPWWQAFDYVPEGAQIDAPALFIESWNDFPASATLYLRGMFERTAATAAARNNQFIIIAPGPHCTSERMTASEHIGDQDAGDPRFGHLDLYLKWFAYWLNGDKNGITSMPKVQYYVLGKNTWRAANEWPIPGTHYEKYYLHSAGQANSHAGDGVLSLAAPGDEPADRYTYDPDAPAPSLGVNDYTGAKPVTDQRPLSAREDVLVYTSAPLPHGVEMTGDIDVVLYASSSALDTDFIAKLVDVYPDGTALNIRENILRARYRNGRGQPAALMQPGTVYRFALRLGAYSLYFRPQHRLRLQVTSSSFPRYDRNLNTGGRNFDETVGVVARNRVYHDRLHASYLQLPIIPE